MDGSCKILNDGRRENLIAGEDMDGLRKLRFVIPQKSQSLAGSHFRKLQPCPLQR